MGSRRRKSRQRKIEKKPGAAPAGGADFPPHALVEGKNGAVVRKPPSRNRKLAYSLVILGAVAAALAVFFYLDSNPADKREEERFSFSLFHPDRILGLENATLVKQRN